MATEWINAQGLAKMLNVTDRSIRRMVAAGHYQGQALITRQVRALRGKPAYQILWDTTTNQPARYHTEGENHDDLTRTQINRPATDRLVGAAVVTGGLDQPAAVAAISPGGDAGGVATDCLSVDQALERALVERALPADEAQATLLLESPARLEMTMDEGCLAGQAVAVDTTTGEIIQVQLDPLSEDDFDTLLGRKLLHKTGSGKRSLAAYYRKQYAESGVIPAALRSKHVGQDGRSAGLSGRKSGLDENIIARFIERVKNAADRASPEFITRKRRRIPVFKLLLEQEFNCAISENQLRSLVKAHDLAFWLRLDTEGKEAKVPGAWPAEPVGALVMMDGVKSHYFKILHDGKYRGVTYIEFFDMGSRKLLAMHAYLSESSENSIDIFKRFLRGNSFVQMPMSLRPDNAGGFVNLKRPMHELNTGSQWCKGYAYPDGFKFIDDYARAGAPRDKAHLEASHKRFHDFEMIIIDRFKDKISKVETVMTKTENNMDKKDVFYLGISLDELNASGLTEQYMALHNGQKHRFTEDGLQARWKPDDRWDAHLLLNAGNTFTFAEADIEACTRYGYDKHPATITKKGAITFRGKQYYVEDRTLWNNQESTDVTISIIDGHLAIFAKNQGGKYLGDAHAIAVSKRSEKIIAKTQAKIAQIDSESVAVRIAERLRGEEFQMQVDAALLSRLVAEGLTWQAADDILAQAPGKYKMGSATPVGFLMFVSAVKKWLHDTQPSRVVPYAAGGQK